MNLATQMTPAQIQQAINALQGQLDASVVPWKYTKQDGRGQDKPVGCAENTEILLKHYNIEVRYNEMTKNIEINVPGHNAGDRGENDAIVLIRDYARKQGYSPDVAEENLGPIAAKNAYHPARDWIVSKPWDGVDRVEQLLNTITTEENDHFKRMLIVKWLVSAVAVVMHGTQYQNADHRQYGFKGVEGVLVFKGRQGLGKTQWFERLVPPRSGWVKDAVMLDPTNKDSVLLAVSHWIVELGEINATFKKADIEALKGFTTQKYDQLRPAYAKKQDRYARRSVFAGTVNDDTFLAEQGESRRWWVLGVTSIRPDLTLDYQQLWAQMFQLYTDCHPYWLLPAQHQELFANNAQYERIEPLIEKAAKYVRKPDPAASARGGLKAVTEGLSVEKLGAGEVVERLTGRLANKNEANLISKWLIDQGFDRIKESKKFKVIVDKLAMVKDAL